jgi:hypothetical protein
MKAIQRFITILIAGAVFFTSSCSEDFFTEVNDNPNAPDSVVPAALLSSVCGALAYTQGSDLSRFSSMFTQQTIGVARQAEGWYAYLFTTQDFDNLWGNFYTQVLENNYQLMMQSKEKGYHHYTGVAKILMAYSMQLLVDSWGDVPYTEAFTGIANLEPAFDDDASLYATMNTLIEEGISTLSNPEGGDLVPGADDFIYGGDIEKWILFAHALKARLAIHLSAGNASKAQEALAEVAQSFTGNEQNAQMFFGNSSTTAAPWYQFNTQRGDISFSTSTLAAALTSLNDPRYSRLIDEANDGDGLGLAAYYGSSSSPVEFFCYDELKFIEAEAVLRTSGDLNVAQAAYQEGIRANMQKLGVAEADIIAYLSVNGTLSGSAAEAIEQVAYQAWLALYLNPEAWTTYRRTGIPELVAVDGNAVPRRLLYSQTTILTTAPTCLCPRCFLLLFSGITKSFWFLLVNECAGGSLIRRRSF